MDITIKLDLGDGPDIRFENTKRTPVGQPCRVVGGSLGVGGFCERPEDSPSRITSRWDDLALEQDTLKNPPPRPLQRQYCSPIVSDIPVRNALSDFVDPRREPLVSGCFIEQAGIDHGRQDIDCPDNCHAAPSRTTGPVQIPESSATNSTCRCKRNSRGQSCSTRSGSAVPPHLSSRARLLIVDRSLVAERELLCSRYLVDRVVLISEAPSKIDAMLTEDVPHRPAVNVGESNSVTERDPFAFESGNCDCDSLGFVTLEGFPYEYA